MANISAKQVKELRETTSAGMMDCKKALVEADGDMEKAITILKDKGIAKAAKKADRVAAEGLLGIKIADDFASASLVEINSETDFVAKNDGFITLVNNSVNQAFANAVSTVDELNATTYESTTFGEYFTEQVTKIGEKIELRRFATLNGGENGVVNGYIHSNGRVGVIVKASCDNAQTAQKLAPMLKNISMHAAAMKPSVLSAEDFDATYVEEETKGRIEAIKKENEERARLKKPLINVPLYISRVQLTDEVIAKAKADIEAELKAEGKPEKIWDRIVPGKVERFIADNTTLDKEQALLEQNYVMDDSLTVAEAFEKEAKACGGTATIIEFVKYEVGEGIEKKEEDFAAEVAAQMA
jgi:elongation factor Ts